MFQFFSFHFKTFTKLYLFRTRNNKDSEQSTRKFVPLYFSLILLVEGKFCLCNIFFCCFICVIFCLCKCSFMLLLCFDEILLNLLLSVSKPLPGVEKPGHLLNDLFWSSGPLILRKFLTSLRL